MHKNFKSETYSEPHKKCLFKKKLKKNENFLDFAKSDSNISSGQTAKGRQTVVLDQRANHSVFERTPDQA